MNETLLYYLNQAAQNDKEAFTKFAESISKRVLSIAYKITNDKMHSEDVLNLVLLKTWQNIDKIIKLKNPIGYINTIACNAALDIKRKQRDLPLFETVTQESEDSELKADIVAALSKLNAEEREIILYHIHAGYSFRKIALLMNLTKKAVYLKYNKGIEKLRQYLTE